MSEDQEKIVERNYRQPRTIFFLTLNYGCVLLSPMESKEGKNPIESIQIDWWNYQQLVRFRVDYVNLMKQYQEVGINFHTPLVIEMIKSVPERLVFTYSTVNCAKALFGAGKTLRIVKNNSKDSKSEPIYKLTDPAGLSDGGSIDEKTVYNFFKVLWPGKKRNQDLEADRKNAIASIVNYGGVDIKPPVKTVIK